nr:MAG TPA: hypothetical protein [Caudoviricetes sp.]
MFCSRCLFTPKAALLSRYIAFMYYVNILYI